MEDTGSKILLRAVDEFERLRGTNLAWFGIDELTYAPEGAWSRLEGRLRDPKAKRLCGFAVWTPKGFDWVYRRFIQNPAPEFEAVIAAPYENRYVLRQAYSTFTSGSSPAMTRTSFGRKCWEIT